MEEQYIPVTTLSSTELAANLRKARLDLRLTQNEMGKRLGLSGRMVRYMEHAERGARPHIHAYAQATGLPEEWFYS